MKVYVLVEVDNCHFPMATVFTAPSREVAVRKARERSTEGREEDNPLPLFIEWEEDEEAGAPNPRHYNLFLCEEKEVEEDL